MFSKSSLVPSRSEAHALICDRGMRDRSFQISPPNRLVKLHGDGGSPGYEGGFVELLALLEGQNTLLGEGSDEKQSCMYIWKYLRWRTFRVDQCHSVTGRPSAIFCRGSTSVTCKRPSENRSENNSCDVQTKIYKTEWHRSYISSYSPENLRIWSKRCTSRYPAGPWAGVKLSIDTTQSVVGYPDGAGV